MLCVDCARDLTEKSKEYKDNVERLYRTEYENLEDSDISYKLYLSKIDSLDLLEIYKPCCRKKLLTLAKDS